MFNTKKLTKSESTKILESIRLLLETNKGMPLIQAIEFNIKIFSSNKRISKILGIIREELRLGIGVSETLEIYGLLTPIECVKFDNYSGEIYVTIGKILVDRKSTNRFNPPLKSACIKIYLTLVLMAGSLYYFQDFLITKLTDQFTSNGIKNPMEEIPLIIKSTSFNLTILAVLAGLYFLIAYIYNYYYQNKRDVIYKLIKLKELDDSPLMFETMGNFYGKIKETNRVFEKMAVLPPYVGLRRMFNDLSDATSDYDSTYHDIFRKYGFSKDVCELISIYENGVILEKFIHLGNYSKDIADKKLKQYQSLMAGVGSLGPYVLFMILTSYISYLFGIDMDALSFTGIK